MSVRGIPHGDTVVGNVDLNLPQYESHQNDPGIPAQFQKQIADTSALRREMEIAHADEPQSQGRSLDQLADDTLMRVSAFIGECVGGETFCGIAVDEVRDENGLLLSLQLVPCDLVAGEPARRVGK